MNTLKGTLHWSRICYAVDVRGDMPVVVRGERRGAQVRITAVDPEDASFKGAAAMGIPVVAAVTASKSMIHWIETPLRSKRKALRVLPTLLDIQLPFPLHQSTYAIVGEDTTPDGRPRWRLAVTREADAREVLGRLEALGPGASALDCQGLALWTQAGKEVPRESGDAPLRVIVELAGDSSAIVMGRGSDFLAAHAVRNTTPEAIRRLVQAQAGSPSASVEWLWTGPGAEDEALLHELSQPLLEWFPGASKVLSEPGQFLARALATRALEGGPLRCNLLKGELEPSSVQLREDRKLMRTAMAATIVGALLIAGNVVVRGMLREHDEQSEKAFSELRDRLLGYHMDVKGQKALDAVRVRVDEQKESRAALLEALEPSLTRPLAEVMKKASAEGIRIKDLKLNANVVLVSGATPSKKAAEALAESLRTFGFDAASALGAFRNGGEAPFTVEGRRNDE